MLGNLSSSLIDLEYMITGLIYIMGLVIFLGGLVELSKFGMGHQSDPEEKIEAIIRILVGSALIFLPSTFATVRASLFGQDNPMSYFDLKKRNFYDYMKIIMQVAGMIWLSRGVLMIIGEKSKQQQKNFMALAYILAGTMSLNLEQTRSAVNYTLNTLMSLMKQI
jgi:intracellular multiplication protein IcmC